MNYDCELRVDEQQHNIKHLLDQCELNKITTVRTPIKNYKSLNVCVTSNERFEKKKYIQRQNMELFYKYFGNIFRRRQVLDNHMDD